MRSTNYLRFGTRSLVCSSLLLLAAAASAQTQPAPSPAAKPPADEKTSCIEAFDQAQRERAAAHLLQAQKLTLGCSQPVCGTTLMSECSQMYSDIERALPSVVLSAHDESNNLDLTVVKVTFNGEVLTNSLDGKPIPVDPGEYEVVFEAPGHEPEKRLVVIGMGDKYRALNVLFPTSAPAASAHPNAAGGALTASGSRQASSAQAPHAVPVMTWVLGGVGVAGLATGGALRLIANGDFNSMKEDCAARGCPDSDVDALEQKYLISNIAFGVGAAAAAGALIWYMVDVPGTEQSSIAIVPAPGGGLMTSAMGRF